MKSCYSVPIAMSTFVAFTLGWTRPSLAAAPNTYAYTVIAESIVPSGSANAPVITNDGTVVYAARYPSFALSIFSGDGTVTRQLIGSIDDLARIAFSVSGNGMLVTNVSKGIIDVHNGSLLGLFDPEGFFVGTGPAERINMAQLSINNRGSVAFTGSKSDLCSLNGISTIAQNGGVYRFDNDNTTTVATFGSFGDLVAITAFPSINESSRVAFLALPENPFPNFSCPRTVESGFLFVGDGKKLVKIAAANSAPSLNNRGQVGFIGVVDGPLSILVTDGTRTRIVADTNGPFDDFPFAGGAVGPLAARGISINDAGNVAFVAAIDTGGSGIFTGPDVVRDKVIVIGDLLAGSSVSGGIRMSRQSLNESGQIAFQATLADGRIVVVRADPID